MAQVRVENGNSWIYVVWYQPRAACIPSPLWI